jgi:hypothetical protein
LEQTSDERASGLITFDSYELAGPAPPTEQQIMNEIRYARATSEATHHGTLSINWDFFRGIFALN